MHEVWSVQSLPGTFCKIFNSKCTFAFTKYAYFFENSKNLLVQGAANFFLIIETLLKIVDHSRILFSAVTHNYLTGAKR
jgi:hypothetical protein